MKKHAIKTAYVFMLCPMCLFFITNCASNSKNSSTEWARQDAPIASFTLLAEMKEATGWSRDSLGQWKSSDGSKIVYSIPDEDNNFTHITFYNVQYGGKSYIVIDIGYLDFITAPRQKFTFVDNTMLSWYEREGGTDEWSSYYIIDPRNLKISLRENRLINNSIKFLAHGLITPNGNIQETITVKIRSDKNFSGRIHIYTLYYKDEDVVRFYIEHYLSTGILGKKIFEDYYYEVKYQDFVDVFGKWIK
jgi:hypothetical protein